MVAYFSQHESGSFLEKAVIARAPAEFLKRPPIRSASAASRSKCGKGGGGSVGSLSVSIPQGNDSLWVAQTLIPMLYDNVLLLEVDSTGRFTIVGRAHVRPRLTPPFAHFRADTNPKRAAIQAGADAMWGVLRTSPTVRRFMK